MALVLQSLGKDVDADISAAAARDVLRGRSDKQEAQEAAR
jgi:hypothetical protein